MTVNPLFSDDSNTSTESFSLLVDYDTVAETVGLTCSGTGHATLTLTQTSSGNVLGSLNSDQYGTTTGTLTNGVSDGPVTYSGQRVIVLGPGATGIDKAGLALAARKVPNPNLDIGCSWNPNADG